MADGCGRECWGEPEDRRYHSSRLGAFDAGHAEWLSAWMLNTPTKLQKAKSGCRNKNTFRSANPQS